MTDYEMCQIFAKNLNAKLREHDMTQVELAHAVNAGAATVNDWVKGRNIPRTPTLNKLTALFDCPLSALLAEPKTSLDDEDVLRYLDVLKNRSEMRMLFDVSEGATKEQIEAIVHFIEGLQK